MQNQLSAQENLEISIQRKIKQELIRKFIYQKNIFLNTYSVRSGLIGPGLTVPANINISADSDFQCNFLNIVIDKEFTDDMSTIMMTIIDAGSARRITREAVDIRTIASPGIFAPGVATEGNAHFTRGMPFPFLFGGTSTIQFEFVSTETAQDANHKVSITLIGDAFVGWARIPYNLSEMK